MTRNVFRRSSAGFLAGKLVNDVLAACFMLVACSTIAVAQPSSITAPRRDVETGAPPGDLRDGAWLTATARVLGGIEPSEHANFRAIAQRNSATEHCSVLSRVWKRFSAERLAPAANFAARELGAESAASGPVYYPFSGPDVSYPLALFPAARDYVLTGLEPVGTAPDLARLSDREMAQTLIALRRSLAMVLAVSFFRTDDMSADLTGSRLYGVTPILLALLGRHGASIHAVEPFSIHSDASVVWVERPDKMGRETITGVRIRFRLPGDATDRRLHYLSADLGDSGIARTPQYLPWLESIAPKVTFLKAASYLMHKRYFSTIRGFIVERSDLVLQDDSGIPLRFFPESAWERRLYGVYAGPIALFANRRQGDLQEAYSSPGRARELEFGIGYRSAPGTSNLQVFVRRHTNGRREG